VPDNYHVAWDGFYYSVFYTLYKQTVTLRVSGNIIEVLDENDDRVATHERRYSGSCYVTILEHMPPNHQHQVKFNGFDGRRYSDWAKKIGENTAAVIDRLFKQQIVEEQAYCSCMGILQMSQTYGNERLEAACAMALGMRAGNYTTIRNILKNGQDTGSAPLPTPTPEHGNLRGQRVAVRGGEKMINQTLEKLQAIKQAAMVAEYRRQLETRGINDLSFEERLAMIVDAQWLSRQNARLKRLLHTVNLRDPAATLSDLSCKPERMLDKNQVARLSDLQWIRDGRNLLVPGPTGPGKTYLVSAFGRA